MNAHGEVQIDMSALKAGPSGGAGYDLPRSTPASNQGSEPSSSFAASSFRGSSGGAIHRGSGSTANLLPAGIAMAPLATSSGPGTQGAAQPVGASPRVGSGLPPRPRAPSFAEGPLAEAHLVGGPLETVFSDDEGGDDVHFRPGDKAKYSK